MAHEKTLGIDVDQAVFERKGIDAILHKPLTLINEDFQYKSMKKKEVETIRIQKVLRFTIGVKKTKIFIWKMPRSSLRMGRFLFAGIEAVKLNLKFSFCNLKSLVYSCRRAYHEYINRFKGR